LDTQGSKGTPFAVSLVDTTNQRASKISFDFDPGVNTPVIRIFIVADVRLYREGLTQALTAAPTIEVVGTAVNVADAEVALRAAGCDVTVLDTAIPDSLAALHRLAATVPSSRLLAISVPDLPDDFFACTEAGIAGYLTREASAEELVAAIESVARGEMFFSPQMGASLLRRVATFAADGKPLPLAGRLTPRELEVLELIDQGLSNKEISRRLFIEVSTVKNHVHNILEKLAVARRSEAGRQLRAARVGLAVGGSGAGSRPEAAVRADSVAVHFGRAAGIAVGDADAAMPYLPLEAASADVPWPARDRFTEGHDNANRDFDAVEQTPPALWQQTPRREPQVSGAEGDKRLWRRLRRAFAPRRQAAHTTAEPVDGTLASTALEAALAPQAFGGPDAPRGRPPDAKPGSIARPRHRKESPRPAAAGLSDRHTPSLTAYLLGPQRLALNDCPLDDWPSVRGRALFKYMLTHRDLPPSREALMEALWPRATLTVARHNLKAALNDLRRPPRAGGNIEVVVLERGSYLLRTDLRLWLDVDEFERHVADGRQRETAGELAEAMSQYELAGALYQGDFLADDLDEEWPILTRERLRLSWLDTIDRLSHLYFSEGRYASCATLCQLLLGRDPCREDAHRRLIRCYSRQRQPHLALRQYRICVEALRAELSVEAAPETVDPH
jgi:DNA-binding NarL/FixJ family response regulator/DNA-binding SARP family transcriptional activator